MELENDLFLMVSPPGSGKTSFLFKYMDSLLEKGLERKILILCPLKALERELQKRVSRNSLWKEFFFPKTPESLSNCVKSRIKSEKWIVVFDEIHLFSEWGCSFRPTLWEAFLEFASSGCPIFAFTATLPVKLEKEIKSIWSHQFRNVFLLDEGNNTLLNKPGNRTTLLDYHKAKVLFFSKLKNNKSKLCFFRTRKEVLKLSDQLDQLGVPHLTCLGGGAECFERELASKQNLGELIILSTSVLSHGVNLPNLDEIWLFIKEENFLRDFQFIQMVGRGGRNGECYDLYCFRHLDLTKTENCLLWLKSVTRYYFTINSVFLA